MYGEIRPDIAHIRPDIIHIWEMLLSLFRVLGQLCVTHVISGGAWKSRTGHNSHPVGCYTHTAGCVFVTFVSDSKTKEEGWVGEVPLGCTLRWYVSERLLMF